MARFFLAACASLLLRAGIAVAAPKDDPAATWDLSELFPTVAAWETERAALEKEIAGIARFKGTLGRDAKSMLKAMDALGALDKRLARMAVYASLKSDEDVRASADQARNQAGATLLSRFGEATAWIRPEVLSIGAAKVESL
jgi:oligoendopeptidase F